MWLELFLFRTDLFFTKTPVTQRVMTDFYLGPRIDLKKFDSIFHNLIPLFLPLKLVRFCYIWKSIWKIYLRRRLHFNVICCQPWSFTKMHALLCVPAIDFCTTSKCHCHDGGFYNIEPSPLICSASQWTGV